MTTAAAIAERMKQTGRKPGSGSILTVVMDDHNVHCITESHLDTWWHSLDPAEKADVYEEHLERQVIAEDSAPAMASAYPWSSLDEKLLSEATRVSSNFATLSNVKLDRIGKPVQEDGHAIR